MISMESKSSKGISSGGVLTTTFIILKLLNIIDWSWWWVFFPIWVPICIGLLLGIIIGLTKVLLGGD